MQRIYLKLFPFFLTRIIIPTLPVSYRLSGMIDYIIKKNKTYITLKLKQSYNNVEGGIMCSYLNYIFRLPINILAYTYEYRGSNL